MSRTKYLHSTLSGLVDSDSDDTRYVEAMPTPDSGMENVSAVKKGRGRPKASAGKVTKAKAPARRTSGRLATSKTKRAPLTDKTNHQIATSETEEVEEFDTIIENVPSGDELDSPAVVAVKQRNTRMTKVKPANQAIKSTSKEVTAHTFEEDTHDPSRLGSRAGAKKQNKRFVPQEIHETQEDAMDVADDGDEGIEEVTLKPVPRRTAAVVRPASQSRQPSVPRRRAGSASDTERNDPAMRRKLGELTNKFENLDLKYRNLREIGIKEAEHNFERYKKQSEEKDAAAKKLIATLKTDLADQKSLDKELRDLKRATDNQVSEIEKLKADVARLTSSLSESIAENKTLSAKLAANRTAAASVESATSKNSGISINPHGGIRMMGSAEAAQQVQAGQLKEDLYGDLTGLIIRAVKKEAEEAVYDCIQTGRNGTLHFKLAAANEKSSESFEEAQCTYMPLLDPSRDRALMELLPDYLIDEIMFPRQHAAKFYSRISEALTKKQEN